MLKIIVEPEGEIFYNLLDLAFSTCDKFILVQRKNLELNQQGALLLENLKDSLLYCKEQSEWANHHLLESTAKVFHYSTNEQSKKIIKQFSRSLYSWLQPNLPEDLCFFRGEKPWLISISHEQMSYFENYCEEDVDVILDIDDLEVIMTPINKC